MHYALAGLTLTVLCLGLACGQPRKSEMTVTGLSCEYLSEPLGIGETRPRLSWTLESAQRGQIQTAYQILVASTPELLATGSGDLWDSGKVAGNQTNQVVFGGQELISRQDCYWKVMAWDRDSLETAFSTPAHWSMGLLSPSDWQARWVGMKADSIPGANDLPPGPPVPYLRGSFTLDKPVAQAKIYVTARGVFDLYLNGQVVGEDVLQPGWTDYFKRIQYATYDVTSILTQGENALGALLADGWYSGYLAWSRLRAHYGPQNSLLCQLEVEFTDGTKQVINSDDSWRCAPSPFLTADLFNGVDYDARLEQPGWCSAGYDDSGWQAVTVFDTPQAELVSQPSQPVQITGLVPAVSVTEPQPGVFVLDLGQNIAGWARLKVTGDAGAKVTLRFAERLNPDGTIYTTNLRAARATDTYVLKGGGEETFDARFTFHGFQYVELTGFPGVPSLDAVTGVVIHSNTPQTGTFECSDPRVNKLWTNALWGQRGNFISIPTDCPQRDERLGWMGDAQIFVRTSSYNMDVSGFFNKWMFDVRDGQTPEGAYADVSPQVPWLLKEQWVTGENGFVAAPGWGDAGVIIPWTIYQMYGDTRIIEKFYASMDLWMDFLLEANPDLVRRNKLFNNYGDWLSIGADTPKDLLATAYWAYDANLMSKMAAAIGRSEDAKRYADLFERVREAFRKEYISEDGHVAGETQTGYLLALYMDLMPENLRQAAGELLVENIRSKDWHLSSGFLGVRQINLVLTEIGYSEVAYRLLLTDTFPSWLYPVKNGATTIWERWDGWTEEKGFQDPGMNSFNHYSLGSVSEWHYRYVAGIDLDPAAPGFRKIVLHPYPGPGLDYARAEYQSIGGRIASGWTVSGDTLTVNVTVPANTSATLSFPSAEGAAITESGVDAAAAEGVSAAGRENGRAVYRIGSGSYTFQTVMP